MKTIEQQAREYAQSEHHPTGHYTIEQIEEIKEFAYLQGAEDSKRWISVNDDLPEENLFVSVMQDDSDFESVAFLEDGEWACSITNLPLGFEVTHWRHN